MHSYSKMYETDFPDLKATADTVYNLKQGIIIIVIKSLAFHNWFCSWNWDRFKRGF